MKETKDAKWYDMPGPAVTHNWSLLVAYGNFEDDTIMVYADLKNYYFYSLNRNQVTFQERYAVFNDDANLFYRLVDDIKTVAYINKTMLQFLSNWIYMMNHIPKSKALMFKCFEYACVAKDVKVLYEDLTPEIPDENNPEYEVWFNNFVKKVGLDNALNYIERRREKKDELLGHC